VGGQGIAVTSSILVLHTAQQLEQASNLVDLLEASLPLGTGAIRCTSLPGYAWSDGGHANIPFADAGAAIALVDEAALADGQLVCDLGAVWATGKRVAVIVERTALRSQLPVQLRDGHVLERGDRAALAALVEDIAFDLGVDPRLGREANRLIEVISVPPPAPSSPPHSAPPRSAAPPSAPPAARSSARPAPSVPAPSVPAPRAARPHEDETPAVPTTRPPAPDDTDSYEAIESVPPPAPTPSFAHASREDDTVEPLELIEEIEPLRAEADPRPSQPVVRVRCELALEAGRGIGESAFHGEEGEQPGAGLDGDFARFVEGIGGSYDDLLQLADIELWLGAMDNLLEGLPQSARVYAEWYEIGFQYSTLKCIAEQGLPEAPEDREVYDEMWNRALGQLRESAKLAGLPSHELRRVQALLENVVGPAAYRDYTNLGASLRELRELARNADRPANRYARLVN
jgi:hypothetical protein